MKLDKDERARFEALIRLIEGHQVSACSQCLSRVCGHEIVMSVALGHSDAPLCCACLALQLNRDRAAHRDQVFMYLYSRPCFRAAWQWANGREGFGVEALPACLWPGAPAPVAATAPDSEALIVGPVAEDAAWNAGEMGCGDLVLELRLRLRALAPGQVLKVTARDPGAPEDLPAWCRLTGHSLIAVRRPEYFIRRKEN